MAKKNKDYWKERMQALEDEQYQRSMAYYKDVQEQFRQASNSLQMDIERWYRRLADNNGISYASAKELLKDRELEEFHWTVEQYIKAGEENALDQRWMKQLENASTRYHIDRLEAMKLQIRQHAELLFTEYEGGMTDFLQKDYAEQFYRTAYEVSKGTGVGFNLSRIDTRRINALVRRPWAQDGKAFSDRIWNNKEKLVNNLHAELTQCIIRGESPAKAIGRLAKKMDVSKAQAGNLIMTESAAIASAAQKECFKELDLEKFEFDATLDGKTCDICAGMDGQLFLMSQYEVGVTAPPIHPRCRCCVLPGFDDWEEFGIDVKRAARDTETGNTVYVDGNLKYEDWKKQAFKGSDSPEVKEYRIIDASGSRANLKERIPVDKVLSTLPDKVIDSLQDVTIKLNSKIGSGYQPSEKTIYYSANVTRKEIIHEVGHALEDSLFDKEKVWILKKKLVAGLTRDDIIVKSATDSAGNKASIFVLDNERFLSVYQSRLYVSSFEEALAEDGSIDPDVLKEVVSVAVEKYFTFPKAMKKNYPEMYDFVEEALR